MFSEEIKDRLKRRRMKHVKGSLRPKEDEFYAMDRDGIKVNGRYDGEGWFLVDMAQRGNNRCDREGYLVDA